MVTDGVLCPLPVHLDTRLGCFLGCWGLSAPALLVQGPFLGLISTQRLRVLSLSLPCPCGFVEPEAQGKERRRMYLGLDSVIW